MANKDDGGPAFPGPSFTRDGNPNGHAMGMNLRDAAALAALQGIVAGYMSNTEMSGLSRQMIADEAFQYADAFIAARSKGER